MTPMKLRFPWLVAIAGLCAAVLAVHPASPARATSFFERPFPDTVKDAPLIVRGRVGQSYADWGHGQDSNRRIYTYWELSVGEALKGEAPPAGSVLRMRELGGEKDGVGMQVAGAAQFGRDEDVVVLLSERNGEGSYDLWGMMMGKYNVQKDGEGNETLVGPGINSLTKPRIADAEGGHADTPSGEKWTLARLRQLIASQGDSPGPSSHPRGNPPVAARPRESLRPSPAPAEEPRSPAPGLQNSSAEDASSSGNGVRWAALAGALGLAMVLWAKRRR